MMSQLFLTPKCQIVLSDSNFYSDYYTQALQNIDTLEHPFSHWKGKSGPGGAEKGKGYALSAEMSDSFDKIKDASDIKAEQHPGLKPGGSSIGIPQPNHVLNHLGAADKPRL